VVLIAPYLYELEGGAEKVIRSIDHYLRQRHQQVRGITNADLIRGQLDYRFSSQECQLPMDLRRALQTADLVFACGFAALQLVVREQVAADTVLVPFETVVDLPPDTKAHCLRLLREANLLGVVVFARFFQQFLRRHLGLDSIWVRYNLPNEVADEIRRGTWKLAAGATERPFVFCPTRIAPRKNLDRVMHLARRLRSYGIDVRVSGGLDDSLYPAYARELMQANERAGRPMHFNRTSLSDAEMRQHFATCLCAISTAEVEAFGIFALEAIHHGKPVVSFDSIGIRELAEFDRMRSIRLVGTVEEMASEIARMNATSAYYQETLSSVDAYRRCYNRRIDFDRLLQDAIEKIDRKRGL
jgi:glycosyltransferase involved in cell wall biosynthesis